MGVLCMRMHVCVCARAAARECERARRNERERKNSRVVPSASLPLNLQAAEMTFHLCSCNASSLT